MKKTITLIDLKKRFSAYSLYILLFALMVAVSIANSNFLSVQNIKNIFQQISINGILAVGMTFVIITGGIDLSVGSLLGFSGVIAASLVSGGGNPLWAVLAGIVAGLIFGVINGLLISYAKVVPFIVTLGMLSIARGITNVYTCSRRKRRCRQNIGNRYGKNKTVCLQFYRFLLRFGGYFNDGKNECRSPKRRYRI